MNIITQPKMAKMRNSLHSRAHKNCARIEGDCRPNENDVKVTRLKGRCFVQVKHVNGQFEITVKAELTVSF